jgi:hypothetical protein
VSGGIAQAWDFITGLRKEQAKESAAPQNATPISGVRQGTAEFDSFTGGIAGMSGPMTLTPSMASTVTAIHACKTLISGAIASLPVKEYRRLPGGEREEIFDGDIWYLLNEQFNVRWAAASAWEYLSDSLLLRGDGFAHIERNPNGRVIGLRPIHPVLMEVRPNPDNWQRLLYIETPDPEDLRPSGRVVYDQDDILHFPGVGFDGQRGISPLRNHLSMAGSVASKVGAEVWPFTRALTSSTLRLRSMKFCTNNRRPSGERARPCGASPTGKRMTSSLLTLSSTATARLVSRAT